MNYKLGKTPARENAVLLKLKTYAESLPKPPKKYGHEDLVSLWGMLGNDQYGDCVWAGAGHETILWNKEAGKTISISTDNVLTAYSAVTGFNKNNPSTDQGTDMELAAKYRRKTGIIDTLGNIHKIGAYLDITKGSEEEIKQALYLFGVVGIGVEFPDSAMTQFNDGKPWTIVRNAKIDGGHYVPAVGYDEKYLYVITWGAVQKVAWTWIKKYMDEGIVYLSEEFLTDGKSAEGFNLATLTLDLNRI